jgi:DNA-binding HxlR family transcriptional regulator
MPNNSSDSEEKDQKPENLRQSSNPPNSQPKVDMKEEIKRTDTQNIGGYSEPDNPVSKELDQDQIEKFFKQKAAIDILAQLADGPKQFSEINNALVASHGTVATRLTEGAKLGLWGEYITYPDDGGKIKLYELEPEADQLASLAESNDIAVSTERKREAYTQHKEALSTFRNQLTTEK